MVQLRTYPLETLPALVGFLARETAQTVVFRLRVAALLVVEGWVWSARDLTGRTIAILNPTLVAEVGQFVRHGALGIEKGESVEEQSLARNSGASLKWGMDEPEKSEIRSPRCDANSAPFWIA